MRKEEISKVIEARLPDIRACHQKAASSNSPVRGKLRLEWDILADGNVKNVVSTQGELSGTPLEKCVMGVAESFKFPKPRNINRVHVTYPFKFNKAPESPLEAVAGE